jgi:hypothetical protein
MKLHQWEADPIKMGYFLIGISPPENDEEFFMGKMNYARMKTAKGEVSLPEPPPPAGEEATPPSVSGSSSERAVLLSRELQRIITETEREIKGVPAVIRPLIKAGFKRKTGGSIEDWTRKARALVQAVEGGTSLVQVDASIQESLGRLAIYYQETPRESRRFIKDKAELQSMTQRMMEREATLNALISALSEL